MTMMISFQLRGPDDWRVNGEDGHQVGGIIRRLKTVGAQPWLGFSLIDNEGKETAWSGYWTGIETAAVSRFIVGPENARRNQC